MMAAQPIAADSVGVAIPVKIEPRTATIMVIFGLEPRGRDYVKAPPISPAVGIALNVSNKTRKIPIPYIPIRFHIYMSILMEPFGLVQEAFNKLMNPPELHILFMLIFLIAYTTKILLPELLALKKMPWEIYGLDS